MLTVRVHHSESKEEQTDNGRIQTGKNNRCPVHRHKLLNTCPLYRERPEDIAGIGGQEGKRLLDYIRDRCGKLA